MTQDLLPFHSCQTHTDNGICHCLAIRQNIARRKTHRFNAMCRGVDIPRRITLWMIAHIMAYAVNLDRKLCFGAIKVKGIRPKGMIPPDFDDILAAQMLPQKHFCRRHFTAKTLRHTNRFSTFLRGHEVFYLYPPHFAKMGRWLAGAQRTRDGGALGLFGQRKRSLCSQPLRHTYANATARHLPIPMKWGG